MTPTGLVLHNWETVSQILSNAVTAAAIVVGAVWAYWRFVRERTRWPRAEIDLQVAYRRLDPDHAVLQVKLKLRNRGRGLMKLRALRVYLQRVRPLRAGMRASIAEGKAFNKTGVEANWPLIEEHERVWPDAERPELEPEEGEELTLDFFISPMEEVVFVYGYLENEKKKRGRRELGWSVSTLYDIPTGEDLVEPKTIEGGPSARSTETPGETTPA